MKYALYHISSPGLAAATRRVKPCIITIHDLIPFSFSRHDALEPLFKRSMRDLTKAQRLICVSNYTKNSLLHHINSNTKIKVIPLGIQHEIFKPRDKIKSRLRLGLNPDWPIILHVGSEEPRKNIPTLIRTFHKLQKDIPNAHLIRIGRGTPEIQNLIDNLGIKKNVSYYEDVTNLEYYYNAADLFVFPSSYEGFGLPPLEAMASGCPVLTSNSTALPEVVGDAGITVDSFDEENFTFWMHQILTNEDIREKLIIKGINQSSMFGWDICAKETLKVYKEVLQEL